MSNRESTRRSPHRLARQTHKRKHRNPHRSTKAKTHTDRAVRLWGRHAVQAALDNPKRTIRHIWGTQAALESLDLPATVPRTPCSNVDLAGLLGRADATIATSAPAWNPIENADENPVEDSKHTNSRTKQAELAAGVGGLAHAQTIGEDSIEDSKRTNSRTKAELATSAPAWNPVENADENPVEDSKHTNSRSSVYQSIIIEVEPLTQPTLQDIFDACDSTEDSARSHRPLVILDQVTDPRNIGAILRSAAAFNAAAVISQTRHSPSESGTLAKAASGALERVAWVHVVNIARALDQIAKAGWWRLGLDAQAPTTLGEVLGNERRDAKSAPHTSPNSRIALVFGAEGSGLRPNVYRHCDQIVRLPMSSAVESLNISNAAAIALYAVAMAQARQAND